MLGPAGSKRVKVIRTLEAERKVLLRPGRIVSVAEARRDEEWWAARAAAEMEEEEEERRRRRRMEEMVEMEKREEREREADMVHRGYIYPPSNDDAAGEGRITSSSTPPGWGVEEEDDLEVMIQPAVVVQIPTAGGI